MLIGTRRLLFSRAIIFPAYSNARTFNVRERNHAMSIRTEIEGRLPEGWKPEDIRKWALAHLEMPKRSVLAFSFAVIVSSGSAATILIAVRDKGETIYTASSAVLARVRVAKFRSTVLAQTKPLARTSGMTSESWRDVLERACSEIGVDSTLLERIDAFARRRMKRAEPPTEECRPSVSSCSTETSEPIADQDQPVVHADLNVAQEDPIVNPTPASRVTERRGAPTGYVPHACRNRSPILRWGKGQW